MRLIGVMMMVLMIGSILNVAAQGPALPAEFCKADKDPAFQDKAKELTTPIATVDQCNEPTLTAPTTTDCGFKKFEKKFKDCWEPKQKTCQDAQANAATAKTTYKQAVEGECKNQAQAEVAQYAKQGKDFTSAPMTELDNCFAVNHDWSKESVETRINDLSEANQNEALRAYPVASWENGIAPKNYEKMPICRMQFAQPDTVKKWADNVAANKGTFPPGTELQHFKQIFNGPAIKQNPEQFQQYLQSLQRAGVTSNDPIFQQQLQQAIQGFGRTAGAGQGGGQGGGGQGGEGGADLGQSLQGLQSILQNVLGIAEFQKKKEQEEEAKRKEREQQARAVEQGEQTRFADSFRNNRPPEVQINPIGGAFWHQTPIGQAYSYFPLQSPVLEMTNKDRIFSAFTGTPQSAANNIAQARSTFSALSALQIPLGITGQGDIIGFSPGFTPQQPVAWLSRVDEVFFGTRKLQILKNHPRKNVLYVTSGEHFGIQNFGTHVDIGGSGTTTLEVADQIGEVIIDDTKEGYYVFPGTSEHEQRRWNTDTGIIHYNSGVMIAPSRTRKVQLAVRTGVTKSDAVKVSETQDCIAVHGQGSLNVWLTNEKNSYATTVSQSAFSGSVEIAQNHKANVGRYCLFDEVGDYVVAGHDVFDTHGFLIQSTEGLPGLTDQQRQYLYRDQTPRILGAALRYLVP